MTLQQLQDYNFNTKYARWNPQIGRRETYAEAVDRVFRMHEARYARAGIDSYIGEAKAAAKDRLVLGSQRALQFGGRPVLDKNARLYNCTVSYCDRPRFFQEALWLLLCGCGVGFSVQSHHIARLPVIKRPTDERATFLIPDSIEGWADALGALMSSYFTGDQPYPEYAGKTIVFDYSDVRPAGSALSSGIGKAPGPAPLKLRSSRCAWSWRTAWPWWARPASCRPSTATTSSCTPPMRCWRAGCGARPPSASSRSPTRR